MHFIELNISLEKVYVYDKNVCPGFSYERNRPQVFKPRLLLAGEKGQGQSYIAPAVIHKLENLPVHVLDVPSLYCIDAKTPEESCANVRPLYDQLFNV